MTDKKLWDTAYPFTIGSFKGTNIPSVLSKSPNPRLNYLKFKKCILWHIHKIFCQYISRIFPKSRFGYRTVQYVCFPRQIKGPHTYIHTLQLYYSAKGKSKKGHSNLQGSSAPPLSSPSSSFFQPCRASFFFFGGRSFLLLLSLDRACMHTRFSALFVLTCTHALLYTPGVKRQIDFTAKVVPSAA